MHGKHVVHALNELAQQKLDILAGLCYTGFRSNLNDCRDSAVIGVVDPRADGCFVFCHCRHIVLIGFSFAQRKLHPRRKLTFGALNSEILCIVISANVRK